MIWSILIKKKCLSQKSSQVWVLFGGTYISVCLSKYAFYFYICFFYICNRGPKTIKNAVLEPHYDMTDFYKESVYIKRSSQCVGFIRGGGALLKGENNSR